MNDSSQRREQKWFESERKADIDHMDRDFDLAGTTPDGCGATGHQSCFLGNSIPKASFKFR